MIRLCICAISLCASTFAHAARSQEGIRVNDNLDIICTSFLFHPVDVWFCKWHYKIRKARKIFPELKKPMKKIPQEM